MPESPPERGESQRVHSLQKWAAPLSGRQRLSLPARPLLAASQLTMKEQPCSQTPTLGKRRARPGPAPHWQRHRSASARRNGGRRCRQVGNRHACRITDLLQLTRKSRFRRPGQLDEKLIEGYEAGGTSADFDTARGRIELRLRIVRPIVDQVIPVNLPGAIFAGWKPVDLVAWCSRWSTNEALRW